MSFVHLHVHSHYSLLDGLPKIPELVHRAKENGMPAIALTDHGALHGLIEFYQSAKTAGIKPILGMEAYVAPTTLINKKPKIDDHPYHLTMLAATNEGYRNLLELATIAQLDGFYYKPRIDIAALARYSKGLIILSGCRGGTLARLIEKGDYESARAAAETYRDILEKDSYFIELQRNPYDDEKEQSTQKVLNEGLLKIAHEAKLPIVATGDIHYLNPAERDAQDALVCIGTGMTVQDEKRLDMRGVNLAFVDSDEMRKRFHDLPEAIANTVAIADRCEVSLSLGKWFFPVFPLPAHKTADEHLRDSAFQGLEERLGKGSVDAKRRLEYELGIIEKKGYSTYFLVVADFVKFTRENRIITTTRGSAAGSLVAYSLGITTLNPLDFDLPFERFLNPERPSPPDIDVDLADTRRDEVIEYVTRKYGHDRVARICTFGTLLARAAVRDVARALGHPYSFGDRIAKLIPLGAQGMPMSIKKAKELEPQLVRLALEDPEVRRVLGLAESIEGSARHASVHAAGVVIAPSRLTDFIPLQRERGGNIITQYDMQACEAVGLLKIDFLGIRNLSIIGEAVRIIKATTKQVIELKEIPLDDQNTYELLARGDTIGLFQLGGSGMTRYLKELRPTNIFDIMAMISLFRPGPMESIPEYIQRKHHPERVTYLHPSLKPILERSLGILVYQDDVLVIAVQIAGYTWAEADKLRKAMGKKIPEEMQKQKEKFYRGCREHGKLPETIIEELWHLIEPFAAYGFGKAHAASYAIIAYQTAYLKARFPAQFMTAVMTAESGNLETVAEAVQECRKIGIEVLPPDINESRESFTYISDTAIRFGLGAIKNLGSDMIKSAIREREERREFSTLNEFLHRLPQETINKKSLESLIKSGALDRFGERNQLMTNLDRMLDFVRQKNGPANEQQSLFGGKLKKPTLTLSPAPLLVPAQKLAWERELLGLYVSAHPFQHMTQTIRDLLPSIAQTVDETRDGEQVQIVGMITASKEIRTKKGDPMAFITLEDETRTIEAIVFPKTFARYKNDLIQDTMVYMKGKLDAGDQEKKILADSFAPITTDNARDIIAGTSETPSSGLVRAKKQNPPAPTIASKVTPTIDGKVSISLKHLTTDMQMNLKKLFQQNPGTKRVYFQVTGKQGTRTIETNFAIRYDDSIRYAIEEICGEKSTKLED